MMRVFRTANLSIVVTWTIFLLTNTCATRLPFLPSAVLHQPGSWRAAAVSSSQSCVLHRTWNLILRSLWTWDLPNRSFDDKHGPTIDDIAPNDLSTYHLQDVVLRFNVTSHHELAVILEASESLGMDLWDTTATWVDLRLPQHQLPDLLQRLPRSLAQNYDTLLNSQELSEAIYNTRSSVLSSYSPWRSSYQTDVFFKDYQPLSVIYPWMRLLASLFSTHVELINIGISYEGRDIAALRLGVRQRAADEPAVPRKTIVVSGGSHAREWISTSTVNYIAYWFITSYGKSTEVYNLLNEFDWVFIPTLNPDGYDYTWTNDRLWRKNRQKTSGGFCYGIDLDRTWGFMWDGSHTNGNPCSETFAGETAFEGLESHRFAEWAKDQSQNNTQFVGFLDLHSYSQQILYPFSYSCYATPPTLEDLEELGHGLAKAIRIHAGKNYKVTPACKGNVDVNTEPNSDALITQPTSGGGSALDWFYHELLVRHSYQIKLRDTGSYGFLLPKQYIVPTGTEILQAVRYFGNSLSRDARQATSDRSPVQMTSTPNDQTVL